MNRSNILIDCDTCVMQYTTACDDCIVTHLCRPAEQATRVVLSPAEQRAMRWFADAGLVPTLRHRAEASP